MASTYATGTVTVSAGATALTGTGTAWASAAILPGALLYAVGLPVPIPVKSVTSETAIVLEAPSPVALSGVAYRIVNRIESGDVVDLLSQLLRLLTRAFDLDGSDQSISLVTVDGDLWYTFGTPTEDKWRFGISGGAFGTFRFQRKSGTSWLDVLTIDGTTGVTTFVGASSTTDEVTEGSENKYFTESRVRATALSGVSTSTIAAITETDTVLSAMGKLQAQVTAAGARFSNIFYPEDFEAVGNGDANDAGPLQQCITACAAVGGTIYARNRKYKINSPLTCSPTSVDLAAAATYPRQGDIRRVNFDFDGCEIIAGASMAHMIKFTYDATDSDPAPYDSVVSGVRLNGNGLASIGFLVEWTIGVVFTDRTAVYGVTGTGYSVQGYGVTRFEGIYCRAPTCIGLGLASGSVGYGGGDTVIDGCDLYPTLAGVNAAGWSGNLRILNNTISEEDTSGTAKGVLLDGTGSTKNIRDVVISNNEFCGVGVAIYAYKYSSARNVGKIIVSGNHLTGYSTYSSAQFCTWNGVDEAVIFGNFVNTVGVGETVPDAAGTAFNFVNCSRLSIFSNHIYNTLSGAFSFTSTTNCDIFANITQDVGKSGAGYTWANIYAGCSGLRFRNNSATQTSSSYAQYGIYEQDGSGGQIFASDNTFTGFTTVFRVNATNGSAMNTTAYGTAAPTTGTWRIGDKVINTAPSSGGYVGWICTAAGTPGTWIGYGTIGASGSAAGVPVGSIIYVTQSTAPAGYLKANGALASRTAYADLFAAIGTTYGAGDGSTTFGLPEFRAEFPRGWDDGRGIDSGRALGSSQADEIKAHTHYMAGSIGGGAQASGFTTAAGPASGGTYATSSTGGTETRPRNVALLACIKY